MIFGLALGMTSCVETMKDGDMSTGFLGVPVLDADIQVEEFGATKATPAPTLPTLSVPDTSALHFKVTDSKSNPVWDKDGLWRTPLKMPVGEYTIEVNYGSNTYRNPWYTGTYEGTISAVTEEKPEIRLSLCNSILAVVLADAFTQHFTPSEGNCVTISSTSGSITTTLGNYVFVPAGEALTIQVAGTSSAGISKTLSWTLPQLSAATASYITCDMTTTNAPVITMSSKDDDYGAWGTVAYIPFASTQNINAENAAKMEYLASSDGINFIKGEIVEGVNVKFTGLTTGQEYSFCAKVGSIVSDIKKLIVDSMPVIVVTATGTTSYDYYQAYINGDPSKLTEANNAAPETVSGIGYSVSGIGDKLKQDKFGYSETLEYDGSPVPQDTTMKNQYWGKHTVSATVTFAGQTFNGYKDCHVTGLPYEAAPPNNSSSNLNRWSIKQGNGKVSFTDSYVSMGDGGTVSSDPTIQSPLFHIPTENKTINILLSADVNLYTRKVWGVSYHCTLTVTVNGTTASKKSSSTSGNHETIEINSTFNSDSDSNFCTFSTDGRTELSGYCHINKVGIKYK